MKRTLSASLLATFLALATPAQSQAQDNATLIDCATAKVPAGFSERLYRGFTEGLEKDSGPEIAGVIEQELTDILVDCIDPEQFDPQQFEDSALILGVAQLMGAQLKVEAQRRLEMHGIDPQSLDAAFLPALKKLPLDQIYLEGGDDEDQTDPDFAAILDQFLTKNRLDPKKVEIPIQIYVLGLAMELAVVPEG